MYRMAHSTFSNALKILISALVLSHGLLLSHERSDADAMQYPIHYMKTGKSGSTTTQELVKQLHDTQSACKPLEMMNDHTITADDMQVGQKSFVVLRDPVYRFVSLVAHYQRWCEHKAAWQGWIKDPFTLGKAMLTEPAFRYNVSHHKHDDDVSYGNYYGVGVDHIAVSWPYSVYINKDTTILCLETMEEGMQRMLDKLLPGCSLPHDADRRNEAPPADQAKEDAWAKNPEVVNLARQVYHDDIELFKKHCK